MSKKILVVDDEDGIRDMLETTLELAGYTVIKAGNAMDAQAAVLDHKPDLILLDWMMPGTSGIEVARRLKQSDSSKHIPIVMLTAKGEEDNLVQGLESGADDYVVKPFSTRELKARIRAVLRRTESGDKGDAPMTVEKLSIDPRSHRVSIDGQALNLGPTEYRLLLFFVQNQERVFTREQLLDRVWGGNVYVEERTVDVHIRRLRKAIASEGCDRFIQTVRGAGYIFSQQEKK